MSGPSEDISRDGVFHSVREGYEAVYIALSNGPTFSRVWRENAYGAEFPIEYAHIGFLTVAEAEELAGRLDLSPGDGIVDVACGGGGPGLWLAARTGATLVGVDASAAGVRAARARARAVGLADRSRFHVGTFERPGLPSATAQAVVTIEAFQYAPDKRRAFAALFDLLVPGGHLGIVCFEVDATKTVGVPVLGVDAVADYRPLLERAGLQIDLYQETPGWEERVYRTFQRVVDETDAITAEMGERAAAGILAEAMFTLAARPYPRRVLAVAHRPS